MNEEQLRVIFERQVSKLVQGGIHRSRRGFYSNASIARDWKWFRQGALAMLALEEKP